MAPSVLCENCDAMKNECFQDVPPRFAHATCLSDVPPRFAHATCLSVGFRQPLVLDEQSVIVVGSTRFKAALKLGLHEVPVHVVTGLTPLGHRRR